MSCALSLILHEGSFGPQPITSAVNINPTKNSTWQVWIMLTGIARNFFGRTLEGRPDKFCGVNSGLHYGLVPSKRKLQAIK